MGARPRGEREAPIIRRGASRAAAGGTTRSLDDPDPGHQSGHFAAEGTSECGGSGFTGRGDSAWLTAHWGWIPARE